VRIRPEQPGDEDAIHELTLAAFEPMPFSDGSEAPIVRSLRGDGDLTISLVAEDLARPNGLAFSEFRGYEDWGVIAFSANRDKYAVILGNPATIDAFKQGIPDNGKPFPDGSKLRRRTIGPRMPSTNRDPSCCHPALWAVSASMKATWSA